MKKAFVLSFLALILSVAFFLFFRSQWVGDLSPFSRELAAGFMGAVITVVITSVLLSAQSMSEVRKEKSVGVFQSKLKYYSDFLIFLNEIVADDVIDKGEVKKLKEWALKLALISGTDVTECLVDFIEQSLVVQKFCFEDLSEEEKERWSSWFEKKRGWKPKPSSHDGYCDEFVSIGTVVCNLKVDLGEDYLSSDNQAIKSAVMVDEMLHFRRDD